MAVKDTTKLVEDEGLSSTSFAALFFSIFAQIMIRARGTGIDVPVWVEREVLHLALVFDDNRFFLILNSVAQWLKALDL